jgi:hypothetical protein
MAALPTADTWDSPTAERFATLAATDQSRYFQEYRCYSLYWPFFFVRNILGKNDIVDYIHGADIELVLKRLLAGHRKQFIEWPRRFMKTSTFTTGLSVWFILPSTAEDRRYAIEVLGLDAGRWDRMASLRNRNYSQLICFETVSNAQMKLAEVRWHFESNDLFKSIFPELAYRKGVDTPWNNEGFRIGRTGAAAGIAEGTFDAAGVGVALQSRHYDIFWLDDLVGEEAKNSELVMEKTKDWVGRLTGAEKLGAKTWWFGVSNRWGFNDLNSALRLNPTWVFFTRTAWVIDEHGERQATFPEKYPLPVLDEIKEDFISLKGGGSDEHGTEEDFYAQFLNDPRPPGERQIEAGRIHRYKVNRHCECVCDCGVTHHPENMNRYLLFDPYNAKGNTRSKSAPALAVVGLAHDKHVFLLDAWQKKVSQSQLIETCFKLNDRWDVLKLVYEDVGAQNMWELVLRKEQQTKEFRDAKHRPIRHIAAVGVKNKPLDVRVRDYLVPVLEARPGVGTFSVRDGHTLLFDMLDTFPHSVPGHDYDLLSALAQGPVVPWQFPYAQDDLERYEREEDEYLEQFNEPYSQVAVA